MALDLEPSRTVSFALPPSLFRRLHEAVPSSEWATTKGGHACLWEHPESFNRAVLEFLRRQRA